MNTPQSETTNLLQHVDARRRSFLAKLLAGSAALPVMSTMALGQSAEQSGKGKGGKGKGGKGKGGKGKGARGKGKGGAGQADPAALAKRLIKQFDKDGDGALNVEELTAAMKSLSQQRQARRRGRAAAAGKGKAGRGKGKGKGKGQGNAESGGGVRPKRPESE